MASPANAAILDGMPHPADLRVHHHEGTTFVTAGLVRPSGPKPKLAPQAWARAAKWRAAGASEAQVAARLGVAQATVSRHLAGAGQQELLPGGGPAGAADAAGAGFEPQPEPAPQPPAAQPGRQQPGPGPGLETARPAAETETARAAGLPGAGAPSAG